MNHPEDTENRKFILNNYITMPT